MNGAEPRGARRPTQVLIAGAIDIPGLDAGDVEGELARALDVPSTPLEPALTPQQLEQTVRAARALVLLADRLDSASLAPGPLFDMATRARQSGVPAFAVARESSLTPFDARILDLQLVLTARTPVELKAAAARLAAVL